MHSKCASKKKKKPKGSKLFSKVHFYIYYSNMEVDQGRTAAIALDLENKQSLMKLEKNRDCFFSLHL